MGQAGQPKLPAGTYVRQVLDRLLIDLSWNSSRLEGNTYSLLETQRLFEFGENAEGKAAADAQMILNHKAAIEMLVDQAGDVGFNRYTICNLHVLTVPIDKPACAASSSWVSICAKRWAFKRTPSSLQNSSYVENQMSNILPLKLTS